MIRPSTKLIVCRHRRAGFTLIEILGVIALVGIFSAIAYITFSSSSKEDAARRVHDANTLAQTMPAVIVEVATLNRTLAGTTKTLLTRSGAPEKNALGDAWTVTSTVANKIVIAWPTAKASDPDIYGQGLVTALTTGLTNPGMLGATPPTYDAATDKLTVTYTR